MTRSVFLRCPRLLSAGFEHGFGTRHSRDRTIRSLATARQVHGTRVVQGALDGASREADALWTGQPGLAVGIYTADCVPILLMDRRGGTVAAVHAGWRGSAAGIAAIAVETLRSEAGVQPADIWAVIGPHIGACCYEVDEPVVSALSDRTVLGPASRAGHFMLDLFELNRRQLLRAGISSESVLRVPGCTHCNPLFDSYRRDGTGGRMRHYVRCPFSPIDAARSCLDTEKR